jgi:ADP-dependent NAD(P)H-hydrate dehydratase / NAD(P)H-hydrate epimerase
MRIVTGQVMAAIDRASIQERGIPSLALMERAGWNAASLCHRLCGDPRIPILILCGRGNNGGDGFVVARHLLGWGYRPHILMTQGEEALSPDSQTNWKRFSCSPCSSWEVWDADRGEASFERSPVVVDALLGTGSRGAPESPIADLIRLANQKARWILGVDIPSGVDSVTGEVRGEAMMCRATMTFGLPKRGHFLREGLDCTGQLRVADIGFPKDLLSGAESDAELLTPSRVKCWLPRYPPSTHKGMRGRTLLVAGSAEMLGAALLAARASLNMGTGLLTLALPASLNPAAKVAVPECMTLPLPESVPGRIGTSGIDRLMEQAAAADAAAIGPGLGRESETRGMVLEFLEKYKGPVVVDADGLNAMVEGGTEKVLKRRQGAMVLTPHPGEMSRLLGLPSTRQVEEDRWELVSNASTQWNCTVLLKGAATVIASPGRLLTVNRTGHSAMAQGGMGDALTGMILALLGQGLGVHEAASVSAFIHGRAGEKAAQNAGTLGITASSLIDQMGAAAFELTGPLHVTSWVA